MRRWYGMMIGMMLCTAASAPVIAQGAATAATSESPVAGAQTPPPAGMLIAQAVKTAKADKKAVIVYFGASWCGYCKRFDAFLHSDKVGKLIADNYVLLHLTAQESADKKALENPGVDSVSKAMGVGGGLPYFFVLDGDGKKVATSMMMPNGGNMGYPAAPEEVKAFGEILQQTAPRMSEAERTSITDYLTALAKA